MGKPFPLDTTRFIGLIALSIPSKGRERGAGQILRGDELPQRARGHRGAGDACRELEHCIDLAEHRRGNVEGAALPRFVLRRQWVVGGDGVGVRRIGRARFISGSFESLPIIGGLLAGRRLISGLIARFLPRLPRRRLEPSDGRRARALEPLGLVASHGHCSHHFGLGTGQITTQERRLDARQCFEAATQPGEVAEGARADTELLAGVIGVAAIAEALEGAALAHSVSGENRSPGAEALGVDAGARSGIANQRRGPAQQAISPTYGLEIRPRNYCLLAIEANRDRAQRVIRRRTGFDCGYKGGETSRRRGHTGILSQKKAK
ncbi:MAG: hypothetical protein PVJ49_15620 [Acidobacteriota bacterium]